MRSAKVLFAREQVPRLLDNVLCKAVDIPLGTMDRIASHFQVAIS
jgi:hypothetical protein